MKLPFLDFSSLERRRQFCTEELRLNRRKAPEIYLDVVEITVDGDQFHMNGSGTAIDYAVKMRQFPQESLFSNLLSKGALDAERIKELAKAVADFHLGAAKLNAITPFGEPEQIRKMIEDNYSITTKFVGDLQTRRQFDETKAYTDRFFANNWNLLKERAAGGRIR